MPEGIKFFSQAEVLQPDNWSTGEQIRTQYQFLTTIVAYVMALHNVLHLWRIRVVDSNVSILNSISIERVYPLSPFQCTIFQDVLVSLQKRKEFHQNASRLRADETGQNTVFSWGSPALESLRY